MNTNRNKKIEEILNSLDGTQKAVVPDFFYTRLKARMLARHESGKKESDSYARRSWVLRPAFALTVLVAVLLLNVFVIYQSNNGTGKEQATNDSETLQSIAAEYSLNDNNYVYDLNQDK
jgi:type VI protein secretion system component VasK